MRVNIQPIEKYDAQTGPILYVHSIFYTIQGEGPFCGTPAVFIRLAGCNLQCPGCDTDYTTKREALTSSEIAERVNSLMPFSEGLVVITGGEPFRQNISELCSRLLFDLFHVVQVETNGTLPPPPMLSKRVNIVCSPKAGKVNAETAERAMCFKYVLSHTSMANDGLPTLALGHSATPHVARPPHGFKGKIYLQPMDTGDPVENVFNVRAAVESCMRHGYIMQLQTHKILNLE